MAETKFGETWKQLQLIKFEGIQYLGIWNAANSTISDAVTTAAGEGFVPNDVIKWITSEYLGSIRTITVVNVTGAKLFINEMKADEKLMVEATVKDFELFLDTVAERAIAFHYQQVTNGGKNRPF